MRKFETNPYKNDLQEPPLKGQAEEKPTMMTGCQHIPLSHLLPGQKAHICGLCGGRSFRQRITSLGLNIGCEVEMMKSSGTGWCEGPILIRAGNTRLMLGHCMAEHVLIHRE